MILSEKLSPSYILGSGGVLFESFILRRCSVKDHNMFMTLVRQKKNSGLQIFVNEEFKNKLVSKFSIPFWYHVIQCCASIHQRNNNKPLEQLTLNLEYRGLSRFGIEIMAACGAATPPRTHDRKRNENLLKYDEENKQIVLEGQAVIAIDNYSHFYGSPTVSLKRTNQIILANNTVAGLSLIREPVNLDFVYTQGMKFVLPCLEKRTFSRRTLINS